MTDSIRRGIILALVYVGLAIFVYILAIVSANGVEYSENTTTDLWQESVVNIPPENVPFVGYWVENGAPMTPPVIRYGNNYYLYMGKIGQQTILLYNYQPIQWARMPGGE